MFGFNVCGQGMFERFPQSLNPAAILLFGYDEPYHIKAVGSACLFFVPTSTNDNPSIVCIVTAKHNLSEKKTGKPFQGLFLKINMPKTASPKYLQIPLKHDSPRNYWISPIGLDFAVIPIPASLVSDADVLRFLESQIVSPALAKEMAIEPGLIVRAICIQPEYISPLELAFPEVIPMVRIGHLSRLGFYETSTGQSIIFPHVIDLHSSPGNSGAMVVVNVPKKDSSTTEFMLLGVIQGFLEEQDSYVPYDAVITNRAPHETSLTLVSSDGLTNHVAVSLKTVANPDLSNVIPVHELHGIRDSPDFRIAVNMMSENAKLYSSLKALPTQTPETPAQPTNAPYPSSATD